MKKLVKVILALAVVLSVCRVSDVSAAKAETYAAQLYSRDTDAGEVVNKVVIDFGSDKNVSVDEDTFKVVQKKTVQFGEEEGSITETERIINKAVAENGKVTLYMDESQDGTLCWLSEGRNYPGKIEYIIEQKKDIPITAADGAISGKIRAAYTCDHTIIDEETAKFQAVKGNLNYQYYDAPAGNSLVVWFHGNGEGDIVGQTENNVAQMLANRGTVAWATEEAQKIFGGADVISFQAPDTWYYAQDQGLLEKAYKDIQNVMAAKGIDPEKVYVSGCSAGGYMATRMMIAYPDLFQAAMINCPALDVATVRGGKTPTDEELISIRNSKTAVWLVQGETDGTVNTENCSKRMFRILTEGKETTSRKFENGLNSAFTTYETKDNKYKLSLYETTDLAEKTDSLNEVRMAGKLMFEEDYDHDGVAAQVKYGDHFSWIYTLNNNPKAVDGTSIWAWGAAYRVQNAVDGPGTTDPSQEPSTEVKVGTKYTDASTKAIYKVTAAGSKNTVQVLSAKKGVKSVGIPATIKIDGVNYKVVSIAKNAYKDNKELRAVTIGGNVEVIGANAFKGCKNLNKIVIQTKKLTAKNVGSNAFKGIHKKAVVKAPKGKAGVYKALIQQKGAGRKIIVKE